MGKPPSIQKHDAVGKPTATDATPNFVGGFHERLKYVFDVNQVPPSGQGRTTSLNKLFPSISKSTLRRLAAGEGYPNFETFTELQRKFGISSDWLIQGTGSPFLAGQERDHIPAQWEIVLMVKRPDNGSESIEVLILPTKNDSIIIVQALGDEMDPLISDGDRVIVDTNPIEIVDGKIYLLGTAKGNVFRRVEKSLGSGWRLIPSNDKYRAETVSSLSLAHARTTKGIQIMGLALANVFSVLS